MEKLSIFVILAGVAHISVSNDCEIQSGALIENCTVESYCLLHRDFRCVTLESLGVGCVRTGMCMTFDDVSSLLAGFCPYHPVTYGTKFCPKPLEDYYEIHLSTSLKDLNDIICRPYNREGVLCGRCKPGHGPAVYAFGLMCVECSSSSAGWVLYFFLNLFPITVFYLILIVFNIRATSPPFAAFVFLCQTFSNIDRVHVPLATRLAQQHGTYFQVLVQTVRVLCGLWNLDFFRHIIPPFCVSSHLANIQALTLEYVGIVYSLVLIFVTYVCIELHAKNFKPIVLVWKPFHRCFIYIRRSWDPKASIINTFSTMLLIYFSKLVFIATLSVFSTKVYGIRHHAHFVYFDPTIKMFSKQHVPYLILSSVSGLFALSFALLLLLYPTKLFRRLLVICLPSQWRLALCAFAETFQGHYKDGTSGTRDYRAISGLQLCLQFIVVCCYSSGDVRFYFITYIQMALVTILFFYAFTHPCKTKFNNFLLCSLFALTVFAVQMIFFDSFYSLIVMLVVLLTTHCLFVVVNITQKVWTNCQCARKPFLYLHNLWSKRHRIKDQQNVSNTDTPSGATEQTRLLHV